ACHLARAEPWSPEWRVLAERNAKLSRRIPPAWTAHLKGRVISSAFERGFVGHVTLYSKRFVGEGGRLFDDDPIRTVKFATLRSTRGSVAPAVLFACPHLARVAKLFLDGSELKDKELTALAASPHTAGLRMLSLAGHNPFARSSLPKLLAARPGITELGLAANKDVGDAHARALAESPALANLTTLDLARTGVTAVGVAALVGSKHAANLKSLALAPLYDYDEEHGTYFGSVGSRADGLAVAQAFAASTTLASLEALDLTDRKLGNNGVAELAQARGLPNLRRLTLAGNVVTKKGMDVLAKTPLGQRLRFIDVRENDALRPHETEVQEIFPSAYVRVQYDMFL
ncbi:MAG TPA: hypothetical protein VMZ71_04315, partial [Gemmataceae bacterium]|nr:hypothetical protein [Gemmataceae bacterium]